MPVRFQWRVCAASRNHLWQPLSFTSINSLHKILSLYHCWESWWGDRRLSLASAHWKSEADFKHRFRTVSSSWNRTSEMLVQTSSRRKEETKGHTVESFCIVLRSQCSIDVTYMDVWPGFSPVPPQLHQSDQMQVSFFLTFLSKLPSFFSSGLWPGLIPATGILLPNSFQWNLVSGSSRFRNVPPISCWVVSIESYHVHGNRKTNQNSVSL